MTDANRQILNLAKEGLSASEIASALGYEEESVAIVLMQSPLKVNELTLEAGEGSMEDLEVRFARMQVNAMKTIEVLMMQSEDESIRAKLAMYVADQRLGLKKPVKAGNVINIVNIENSLRKAKEIAARTLTAEDVIDVAPRQLAVA